MDIGPKDIVGWAVAIIVAVLGIVAAVIGSKRIVEHRRTQDPSPPQEPEPRKREPVSNPNANAQTAQADARNPDSAIVPIREFSPRRFRQAIRPIEMQFRPREFVAIVRPLDAK